MERTLYFSPGSFLFLSSLYFSLRLRIYGGNPDLIQYLLSLKRPHPSVPYRSSWFQCISLLPSTEKLSKVVSAFFLHFFHLPPVFVSETQSDFIPRTLPNCSYRKNQWPSWRRTWSQTTHLILSAALDIFDHSIPQIKCIIPCHHSALTFLLL